MSHSSTTPNYSLPLFADDDTPTWLGDWNGGMNAVDAALNEVKQDTLDSGNKVANLTERVVRAETALVSTKSTADSALSLAKTNEQDISLAETRITANESAIEGLTGRTAATEAAVEDVKGALNGVDDVNAALNGKAPVNHASAANTYGQGTSTNFGHLKVVDSGSASASTGTAASPKMVSDLRTELTPSLTPFSGTNIEGSFCRSEAAHIVTLRITVSNLKIPSYGSVVVPFTIPESARPTNELRVLFYDSTTLKVSTNGALTLYNGSDSEVTYSSSAIMTWMYGFN